MAFAGLRRAVGDTAEAVIVTTAPNATVEPLYDRMPAIIDREHFDGWLGGDLDEARSLLTPWSGELRITELPVGSV